MLTFKQRLDWDVQISGDMEVDEFDVVRPVHLLHRSTDGRLQGCVRLLPSTGPTMLRDTFLVLLDGQPAPRSEKIWESSRFALDVPQNAPKATGGLTTATYELFAAMIEFGLSVELTEIVTVTDARMEPYPSPCGMATTPDRKGSSAGKYQGGCRLPGGVDRCLRANSLCRPYRGPGPLGSSHPSGRLGFGSKY